MNQQPDAWTMKQIEKQNELLSQIAKASERTNELLFVMLTPEQRKTIHDAGVAKLAKSPKS